METNKQFLKAQEQWLDPDFHHWAVNDEMDVYEGAPQCGFCPAEGGEEHDGGCPNSDDRPSNIRWEVV